MKSYHFFFEQLYWNSTFLLWVSAKAKLALPIVFVALVLAFYLIGLVFCCAARNHSSLVSSWHQFVTYCWLSQRGFMTSLCGSRCSRYAIYVQFHVFATASDGYIFLRCLSNRYHARYNWSRKEHDWMSTRLSNHHLSYSLFSFVLLMLVMLTGKFIRSI